MRSRTKRGVKIKKRSNTMTQFNGDCEQWHYLCFGISVAFDVTFSGATVRVSKKMKTVWLVLQMPDGKEVSAFARILEDTPDYIQIGQGLITCAREQRVLSGTSVPVILDWDAER
jgi:hypothetical protein